MNDKKITDFFKEHGSSSCPNIVYFSCRYDGDDLFTAVQDLLHDFAVVYFDLAKHEQFFRNLGSDFKIVDDYHPAVCFGVALLNLAEWKDCSSTLIELNFDILAYGIEEIDDGI